MEFIFSIGENFHTQTTHAHFVAFLKTGMKMVTLHQLWKRRSKQRLIWNRTHIQHSYDLEYALCHGWFSRNFLNISRTAFSENTAGRMLLISSDYSVKISRTPFNPLTPGDNKRSYIYKQTFNSDLHVCLGMYVLLLPAALKS